MKFKSSDDAFSYIESFTNLEKSPNLTAREYRLDRMYSLLELFDQPQQAFKAIHVAGSKGKGSTSAFIAAALNANGYKTGIYSSPHVETYKERIRTAEGFFDDDLYAETAGQMLTRIGDRLTNNELPGGPPTTFELLTLLSFLIFKKTDCQWVVFETGLGGRLDATNVIIPEASVLTIIELEHTEYLGDTIAAIAGEKAGIIKTGVPVFSAEQKHEAVEVFRRVSAEKGSKLFFPEDLIASVSKIPLFPGCSQSFRLQYIDGRSFDIGLKSAGDFQIKNASLAVSVLKNIMPETFNPAAGIEKTSLPGRMEVIRRGGKAPAILLDGAHTVGSIRYVVKAFRDAVGIGDEDDALLIFGAAIDKDIEGMAEQLDGFSKIIISKPGSFKKSDPQNVYTVFKKLHKYRNSIDLIPDPAEALNAAGKTGLPILVTGSFYMVAEIRKLL